MVALAYAHRVNEEQPSVGRLPHSVATQMSCHTECTSFAVVATSIIICYDRVLILAGKSGTRAEENPKDKKQNKMTFLVKKN